MNAIGNPRERLDECESLRGIAIVLVFFYHFLGSLRGYMPNPQASYATALFFGGSIGVDLFFVLSGFLLSLPYIRGSPMVLRQFFGNRALRILPMYYLMVLAGAAWKADWRAAMHAALFQNISLDTLLPFGLVWWSLAIEVQFYLVLPLAVWLARLKQGRYLLAAVLLGLCFCYWKLATPAASEFWAAQRSTLLGRWPQFAIGIAAAWAHHCYGPMLRSLSVRKRRWLGTCVALAALAMIDVLAARGLRQFGMLQFGYWYANYLYVSTLWAVFLVALIDLLPAFRKVVVNPVLHRIGLWSYSIYLVHAVFIVFAVVKLDIQPSDELLSHHLSNLMLFIYMAGATLLVSAATYQLIERPFLRLKHSRFLLIGKVREDVM